MRVYYNAQEYIEFKTATHWGNRSEDWLEILDDNENILAVLNWKYVWLIKMVSNLDA